MIQVNVRMTLIPGKLAEAMSILLSVVERTRTKAGCTGCSLYQDLEDEHTILYLEQWRGEGEMKHHLREEEFREVLLVMEMSSQSPEIRFHTVSRSDGVEIIEEARAVNKEDN
jgi:quinol monooxygenase YgiN